MACNGTSVTVSSVFTICVTVTVLSTVVGPSPIKGFSVNVCQTMAVVVCTVRFVPLFISDPIRAQNSSIFPNIGKINPIPKFIILSARYNRKIAPPVQAKQRKMLGTVHARLRGILDGRGKAVG
ncbi:hypothetical protein B0J12DRAFT_706238 [Macrophomina phaseolina]|uniref:Secreted protein n=1 Tax=Macrophomina phaseolina TaxID=35725 RepID=A0ABQ8FSF4_9PEZI|nr:hypothetical protein B0J12DRAFT_706238 [Macrophomina phaseolina]